jgi:hypothetical protein
MSHSGTSSAQRVGCPRCRVNNFAGKAHCWQCGAPLPPPEAIGSMGPSAPAVQRGMTNGMASPGPARPAPGADRWPPQPPFQEGGALRAGSAGGQRSGPMIAALLICIGLIAFFVVWRMTGQFHGDPDATRSATSTPTTVLAPTSPDTPYAPPAADDTDPIVAESKRFIERESRHAGLPEPPVSGDGRVHLRSGGSISTDQYRDAQRHVQESPVVPRVSPPIPVP